MCRIQWWCSLFLFQTENNPFGANLVQKNQNCQFKLKFGTKTTSIMHNSMMMFTFSVFDWKYSFWAYLLPKFKIVCSEKNLVPRLFRIWRIQMWCSFFSIFVWKFPCLGKLSQKLKILCWSWNLKSKLFFIFSFFRSEIPFLG